MLLKRNIQEKINEWLNKEEIIVLNGPRQVGKNIDKDCLHIWIF